MARYRLEGMPLDRWQSAQNAQFGRIDQAARRDYAPARRRADDNREGRCERASPRISRDQLT